jgi:hypothetical protein
MPPELCEVQRQAHYSFVINADEILSCGRGSLMA